MKPLKGVSILSLALNYPGPAALMRLRSMGAKCCKIEPPHGDPLLTYTRKAYDMMGAGIKVLTADLKTLAGQSLLHRQLAHTDVLITSFRPSALLKLGMGWKTLHKQYPALNMVRIVGAPGGGAEVPGHDLTYQAERGLVRGQDMPPTLFADMGGALMTCEAVLQLVLMQREKGKGSLNEVALSDAVDWLALPLTWGSTQSGAVLGGGHAGYRVYACRDGRVALAALEPHFANTLAVAVGMPVGAYKSMMARTTHQLIERFMLLMTCQQLEHLASERDIPLITLPNS
jgi:crotonobetainyl-CoA:carnitine CoA-transferase CaiB-like acyl-CoA transferase